MDELKKDSVVEKDTIHQEWEKKLEPSFKKEIDDVRQTIYQTMMDFHNYIYPKYIKNYKWYLWFVWDRVASLDNWQSNINYPMISSAVDTMFANVFDFWYEFWINEEWLKRLCTKSFDFRDAGKNTFKEVTKECLITWRWFARDYFINETYKNKFFDKEIETKIKMPTLEYISVFDVMYDKSKSIDKSAYKIIRTFQTWDNIKKKLFPLLMSMGDMDKDKTNKIIDSLLKKYKDQFWSRFSMYDYNPVKWLVTMQWIEDANNWYYQIPSCQDKKWLLGWYNVDGSNNEDAKNYFLNYNKSTYEVVEYNTCNTKYIFINWNIVYTWRRKYQLSEIREITFSSIPWTWNSLWLADRLWNNQELMNMLWNAFADNIKLLLWPMFKVTGNLPIAKSGKIDFWALRAYKTNGTADIEKIQLWVSDFAPINFMQMNEWVAAKESGMNNYVSGWAWAIERTQAWVDVKFNQYKAKLTPLTDSIDQMMWGIARSWIMMFLSFFSKEELKELDIQVEEVYETDENWKQKFKTFNVNSIDIRRIIDENNITFTYNSLYKITKEWARDMIIMNLQPILQYAWNKTNMDEVAKILAWKDFNPEKLFNQNPKEAPMWQDGRPPVNEPTMPQEIPQGQFEQPNEEVQPSEMSDEELLQELANIS